VAKDQDNRMLRWLYYYVDLNCQRDCERIHVLVLMLSDNSHAVCVS